jgi:hypothetical protein
MYTQNFYSNHLVITSSRRKREKKEKVPERETKWPVYSTV